MSSPVPHDAPPRWLMPSLVGYRREWVIRDVLGGLTAGAVVIPQAMAYATIANLPVEIGLYTCILPMVVYALLGGSRAMSVSTTSTIATLTATTMTSAGVASAADDADAAMSALAMLTLLVGAVLLLARLFRLGGLVENISAATVLGVKIGVGGTVAIGQLPKLLGETGNASGEGFVASLSAVFGAFGSANVPTILLSVLTIVTLLVFQRFLPRLPGSLVVAVAGIVLIATTDLRDAGVALIDPVPSGLPRLVLPDVALLEALLPGAFAIAVMAFLESASVARAIRSRQDPQIDSDRELFAVGAANAVGAFFAALPSAGGFSQSAINQAAGARSQISSLVTATMAVLVALFLGPVLSLLPQATLAAMVFVAVASLIDIPQLVRWARISPQDFWIALVVAVVALTWGLLAAVGVGVLLTLIIVLRELNIPRLDIIGRSGSAIAVHLGRGMYTANARDNVRAIIDLATDLPEPTDALVLDVQRLDRVSITILTALEELDAELAQRGVVLHLARLPKAATRIARRTPWYARLEAEGRSHDDVADGLRAASTDSPSP